MTDLNLVIEMIRKFNAEIERVTAERDEARRLYCSLEAEDSEDMEVIDLETKEREIADSLGWDCFKEDGK
ncbi:MAG: hypothetical protein EBR40_11755 [Proteobacteria bacterium]|nr:hypothetical protein [Pseudomonadota bacterium]